MGKFTPESLPEAIKNLFELNRYVVTGPERIHGAEIDLIAKPMSDPFGSSIYIEATVEYVDNIKYGKDLTKLAMIREENPAAKVMIVSSEGFSLPVKERARATRIDVFTYDELFQKFERFGPYVKEVLEVGRVSADLMALDSVYEEPFFKDQEGTELATEFLTNWRDSSDGSDGWLIVIGEYGTGKTALTKVLQYRWLNDYLGNPALPIPFRIELRDFTRQFNARGLLHHFMDRNGLGHISVEFVESLISAGRILLILDGYDEMAQYLHTRERRACLEALAELSAGGARGILTSRPNYFTLSEEMRIFEILYASIKSGNYKLGKTDRDAIYKEQQTDKLLEQFLYRYERCLEDLDEDQTMRLVKRVLADDPKGQGIVLGLLRRIFRNIEGNDVLSLSGKPVIISFLIDVVEGLKADEPEVGYSQEDLTEWQIYKLIVDQLMLRDFRRSSEIMPQERRNFLHSLGLVLSKKDSLMISEDDLIDLIVKHFGGRLRRFSGRQKDEEVERLFADVRGSATLTRVTDSQRSGWCFSHNSLREYLVAEFLISELKNNRNPTSRIPISDAMRIFVASKTENELRSLSRHLAHLWASRKEHDNLGQHLCLLWEGLMRVYAKEEDPSAECLHLLGGDPPGLNDIEVSHIKISEETRPANLSSASFANSSLINVEMSAADLSRANFTNAILDGVNLAGANLKGAIFNGALFVDVNISGADIDSAEFRGITPGDISLILDEGDFNGHVIVEGENALGYLAYNGAKTDTISPSMIVRHHPKYLIVDKIIHKLCVQSRRQRRGLAQRGSAQQDTKFAKEFVDYLESIRLLLTPKGRKGIVEVTEMGRQVFGNFVETEQLPQQVIDFLMQRKP